jgi:uncharacterized protein (TIGR03435 family)
MRSLAWATGLLAFSSGFALAQSELTFEVASVKPASPQANGSVGMRGGPGSRDPGRIAYTNVSLINVLVNAYDVLSDQISGPNWLDSSRYDIDAKIPADTTREQFRVMLQNLLAERFHLGLHREKKDFPVYELVVAKGGPKLKRSVPDRDGSTPLPAPNGRGGATDHNGFPLAGPHSTAQQSVNGVAKMAGNQITMATLAQFLKFPMGFLVGNNSIGMSNARVVDKTGLDGEYDITLEYEWPGQIVAPAPGRGGGPADPPQAAEPAPDLFTALQQQLGLRLERTKEPFDVLVIDHLDKTPTEN